MDHSRTVAASDGTTISYRVAGTGRLLVLINGLANDAYQWGTVSRRLERRGRVVTWDYRGHGRSEPARDISSVTLASTADDLLRVIRAVAEPGEQITLLGYSMGCQVGYEACRTLGRRVAGIVHVLGTFERPFDGLYGGGWQLPASVLLRATPGAALTAAFRMGRRAPRLGFALGRLVRAIEPSAGFQEIAGFQEQLGAVHGPSFKALALAAQAHSAADVLPALDVPVLAISGGLDIMAPPSIGIALEQRLRDCRHVVLPMAGHTGLLSCGAPIADLVEAFLGEHGLV